MTDAATPSATKRIALGICGGIAAYKSAELARLLIKAGYDVVPLMTSWGTKFLGPLTMTALTGHPVYIDTDSDIASGHIEHIALIRSVDLLVIAPLTANTAAKMANGLADNFLTTTYLAHRGPTLVCPAMNTGMLEHAATQRNLEQLRADGVHFCEGEAGSLACGEVGAGRMAEPEVIFDAIERVLQPEHEKLKGKRVLVSAGPTAEDLDPVRYLTNRSSGKMGLEVARAFRDMGAEVTLVHGPVQFQAPADIKAVAVRSAADMADAVLSRQPVQDIVVMAAAVADYRPDYATTKLKKDRFDGSLKLHRTVDILATLGEKKVPGQVLVGFAAETCDVLDNARSKLARKGADVIFSNDVSRADIGFAGNDNHLVAVLRNGASHDFGKLSKRDCGRAIATFIAERCCC